jgi:hypothetical protein
MKAKVWVLCTVLADENAPAMPAVLADETEARAKYDEMNPSRMGQLHGPERRWSVSQRPRRRPRSDSSGPRRRMGPLEADEPRTSKFVRRDSYEPRYFHVCPPLRVQVADVGPITVRPRGVRSLSKSATARLRPQHTFIDN